MNQGEANHKEMNLENKTRDFKCPCGKTYLSYAALFTHIKQKHEGKAPGQISKPASKHQKRGRPPIKMKSEKGSNDNQDIGPVPAVESASQRQMREAQAQQAIRETAFLLEQMPEEMSDKTHLNEIQAFGQMNVYLNTREGMRSGGIPCVADGFSEYAHKVCARIFWSRFQPFYTLFMLFLQFIIDSYDSKAIIVEANLDIFCEHINDFVENHMEQMAEYYKLEDLCIFNKENAIKIFHRFFNWAMAMKYISYQISLNRADIEKAYSCDTLTQSHTKIMPS